MHTLTFHLACVLLCIFNIYIFSYEDGSFCGRKDLDMRYELLSALWFLSNIKNCWSLWKNLSCLGYFSSLSSFDDGVGNA